MTGAPIDASLRRPNESLRISSGNVVADSRRKLAPNPLLEIQPGTERLVLRFADGLGIDEGFANDYIGYSGAGGSSVNASHNIPVSVTDDADTFNDGDILVGDASIGTYLPQSLQDTGIPEVVIGDNPIEKDILVYDSVEGKYRPQNYFESNLPEISGDTPIEDDILSYDALNGVYQPLSFSEAGIAPYEIGATPDNGDLLVYNSANFQFEPVDQTSEFWTQIIIESPQNRQYRFVESLPFGVTITGTQFVFEAGPGSVTFPSGSFAQGAPLFITVSGTTGASSFLRAQINYERDLGIGS